MPLQISGTEHNFSALQFASSPPLNPGNLICAWEYKVFEERLWTPGEQRLELGTQINVRRLLSVLAVSRNWVRKLCNFVSAVVFRHSPLNNPFVCLSSNRLSRCFPCRQDLLFARHVLAVSLSSLMWTGHFRSMTKQNLLSWSELRQVTCGEKEAHDE